MEGRGKYNQQKERIIRKDHENVFGVLIGRGNEIVFSALFY